MDNIALIESFGDFKDEKGISKIDLMAIIEDSLKTLLRKRFDSDDHFDVIVNPDKGDFQIFLNKTIVEDEMSEDDDLEIEISAAKKNRSYLRSRRRFYHGNSCCPVGKKKHPYLKTDFGYEIAGTQQCYVVRAV